MGNLYQMITSLDCLSTRVVFHCQVVKALLLPGEGGGGNSDGQNPSPPGFCPSQLARRAFGPVLLQLLKGSMPTILCPVVVVLFEGFMTRTVLCKVVF